MGATFDDPGFVWALRGGAAPKPADVRAHLARLDELDGLQIEQGARSKLHPELLRMLVRSVFARRPELPLRIYLAEKLDLSFLAALPELRHLQIEASVALENVDALGALRALRSLDLTLPKAVDPSLLRHASRKLTTLRIRPDDRAKANAKAIDLSPIASLSSLAALDLEAFGDDVASVLARLRSLRRLSLRAVRSMTDLRALAPLRELSALALASLGVTDLSPLASMKHLRLLSLWNLPKLTSLAPLADMPSLELVALETLPGVRAFPDAKKMKRLRAVRLAAMKAMRDFAGLARAPALEELVFQKADHQRPNDFAPVLACKTLKRAGFGFQKKDDVRAMTALCAARGIDAEVFPFPEPRGAFEEP